MRHLAGRPPVAESAGLGRFGVLRLLDRGGLFGGRRGFCRRRLDFGTLVGRVGVGGVLVSGCGFFGILVGVGGLVGVVALLAAASAWLLFFLGLQRFRRGRRRLGDK